MKDLLYVAVILLVAAIAYGLWVVKKNFNYSFAYQDLVSEQVKGMVKDECLK